MIVGDSNTIPAPATCEKAPNALHCDHLTSPQVHPMMAHDKEWTCCYCGRRRIEKHIPATSGGIYTMGQHGPYAPKTTVIY